MERTRRRLNDIVDAISQIEALLSGKQPEELETDRVMRAAFERFLEIVSEAARHVPQPLRDLEPTIPWRRVADLGNHLRHAYQKVDAETLWYIHANGELAVLRDAARRLLAGIGKA